MARVRVTSRTLDRIGGEVCDAAGIDPGFFHYGYRDDDDLPRVQVGTFLTLSQVLAIAAGLARIGEIQQQDQPKEKKPCKSESAGSCT